MSRLIDALQKAEDAKRKKEGAPEQPDKSGALRFEFEEKNESEQVESPVDSQVNTGEFELEPAAIPASSTDLGNLSAQQEGESGETTQPLNRRLSDDQLSPTTLEERPALSPRRKRLILVIIVAAILILLGGFYFYFMAADNNQYSTASVNTQNRGFLNSQKLLDTQTTTDLFNNTDANEVQDIIDSARDFAETKIAQRVSTNSETIDAVNALVSVAGGSSGLQIQEDNSDAIFVIKPAQTVRGAADSLAYAENNAHSGEPDAARQEYRALLKIQPHSITALNGLAQLEMAEGNYPKASESYAKILQLDPHNSHAQAGLIRTLQSSDPVLYESELEALTEKFPDAAFIHFMLGNHFASDTRWNEAKGAYTTAINLATQMRVTIPANYHFNLAVILERLKQPQTALTHYKQAQSLATSSTAIFDLMQSRINELQRATK